MNSEGAFCAVKDQVVSNERLVHFKYILLKLLTINLISVREKARDIWLRVVHLLAKLQTELVPSDNKSADAGFTALRKSFVFKPIWKRLLSPELAGYIIKAVPSQPDFSVAEINFTKSRQ